MYHLMAIGFSDPTRALAVGLADGSFKADVVETVKGFCECLDLDDGVVSKLSIAVDGLCRAEFASGAEAVYHELAVEYARLFIGPGPVVVSPYESIHADSEPDAPALLMVGPTAREVLRAYREAGLSVVQGLNEPPDHIATEIEFMYYLCRKETAAWSAGDSPEASKWYRLQRAFAAEHLESWGIEFARHVGQNTTSEFYAALSLLAIAAFGLEEQAGGWGKWVCP